MNFSKQTTHASNGSKAARDSLRGTFTRVCLTVGLLFAAAGISAADDRMPPIDGLTRTAFEPVAPGVLPMGSWPAFRNVRPPAPASANPLSSFTPSRVRDPNEASPSALPVSDQTKREPTEAEQIRQKLTYRYQNPVVLRFMQSLSSERAIAMYRETSNLIDTRHLQPTSYQARVNRAAKNLMQAVGNPAFLQANRLSPSERQVDGFRRSLKQLIQTRPVRTAGDALNMLYWSMQMAGQQIGMSPATVAAEFVYASAESLDKYSTFLPQDESREPSASLEDHVVGIGVEIEKHDSGVRVLRTVRGTPAADAGLKKDDLIVSVNGKSLAGKNLDFAVDLITGPAGTPILLGIVRDDRPASLVTLTRRRVPIYSISDVRMLENGHGVGYIKLDQFAKSSTEEMDKALWELYGKGMESLVIDLRGNPGGLLTTAIELSNKFIPCGTIVSTRGRLAIDNSSEQADYERTWKIPLVVLVDGNSASASEIFAAAIQENRRGLIVGRKSYGKGTVQTHFPLRSVSGNLKLTTARFYSPNGRVMAGSGVTPDVLVEKTPNLGSPQNEERDIEAAAAAAKSRQLSEMAIAHAYCRNGANHDRHLGS